MTSIAPSKTTLGVAVVQMDSAVGAVDRNLEKVAAHLEGRSPGVDLIVFPELTLSGYSVGDRHPAAALRLDDPRFGRLVSATRGVAIAVGLIEETPRLRFYNSLAVVRDGAVAHVHRKISLPTYGVFDEGKIFSRGTSHRNVDLGAFRLAPFLCAEAWSPGLVHLAALDDASLFVFSVASPEGGLGARISSQVTWKALCRSYAAVYGAYVVFVNRVGREGELRFWGESEIIDPFGNTVVAIADDREAVAFATLDLGLVREARVNMPGLRDEDIGVLQRGLARVAREREGEEQER